MTGANAETRGIGVSGWDSDGSTRAATSGPKASTPNMPRATRKLDPGPRYGRVTSIGSDRREIAELQASCASAEPCHQPPWPA